MEFIITCTISEIRFLHSLRGQFSWFHEFLPHTLQVPLHHPSYDDMIWGHYNFTSSHNCQCMNRENIKLYLHIWVRKAYSSKNVPSRNLNVDQGRCVYSEEPPIKVHCWKFDDQTISSRRFHNIKYPKVFIHLSVISMTFSCSRYGQRSLIATFV